MTVCIPSVQICHRVGLVCPVIRRYDRHLFLENGNQSPRFNTSFLATTPPTSVSLRSGPEILSTASIDGSEKTIDMAFMVICNTYRGMNMLRRLNMESLTPSHMGFYCSRAISHDWRESVKDTNML